MTNLSGSMVCDNTYYRSNSQADSEPLEMSLAAPKDPHPLWLFIYIPTPIPQPAFTFTLHPYPHRWHLYPDPPILTLTLRPNVPSSSRPLVCNPLSPYFSQISNWRC